jgi:hypothetical protein
MGKGVNVFTEDAKEQAEFSFVGDIKDVRPLIHSFLSSSYSSQFFLIGELGSPGVANIDLARRAQVKVCGAVTHSDSNAATFTLDVEQYTTAFAEQQKLAATDPAVVVQKSVLHVLGFIPDSPRYKSKKPVPWTKRYVSFGGYLTGISASLEGETLQERFRGEVDHIAFLGTFTPLASTPAGSASTAGSSAGMFRSALLDNI